MNLPAIGWTKEASHHQKIQNDRQLIPVIPPVVVSYDIYVGGLHLMSADILFQEQRGQYHSHVKAHTAYGFWYNHLPWDTMLDAVGTIKKDRFIPSEFKTIDEWKHHPKETRLHFDVEGNVSPEFIPPSHDENREVVSEDRRRGSLDPVTAMLQLLAQVAVMGNCQATVAVFDGKRLFQISGHDEHMEDIDGENYGIYKGSARLCTADFEMQAGEWKEKDHIQNGFWQLNGKERGREPFSIWLASPEAGLPELPVRMQSGSIWGLIVVHLSGWRYQLKP